MKTLLAVFFILFLGFNSKGQNYELMTEKESLKNESLTASYTAQFIKNRKTQDVYDIKMSIRNEGYDLIKLKNYIGQVEFDLSEYYLANINFVNATGSNLTVREGHMNAREIYQRVSYKCDDGTDDGIEKSSNMLIAYGLHRGQTVNSTFRIRVPKDEKPEVEIQFVNYN